MVRRVRKEKTLRTGNWSKFPVPRMTNVDGLERVGKRYNSETSLL